MTLLPDLFSFAYVPNWYIQLDELAALALPEPWRFRNPAYLTKNPDNPILERYIPTASTAAPSGNAMRNSRAKKNAGRHI